MARIATDAQDNFEFVALDLDGIDIRNEYLAIAIYENIFNNDITLSIDFLETKNYLETTPFLEGSTLVLDYFSKYPPAKNDFEHFVMEFECYKTERVKSFTQGKKVYRMHFITKEHHNQSKILVSRPYRDQPTTDMIQSLFDFSSPTVALNMEPSDDFVPLFVVPQWSPWKTINFLCRDALKGGKNDYVFYRDKLEYVCKPISVLMEEGPIEIYKMDQMSLDWEHDKKEEFRTIVAYHQDKANWNSLDNINSGLYGSRLHRYNFLTKTHEYFESLGKGGKFASEDNLHIFDCDNYFNREKISDYRQNRLEKIFSLSEERVVLQLRTNTNITCGKTIDIEFPTTKELSIIDPKVSKEKDQRLTGKYLISKLKHEISPSDSKMIVEVIKVP